MIHVELTFVYGIGQGVLGYGFLFCPLEHLFLSEKISFISYVLMCNLKFQNLGGYIFKKSDKGRLTGIKYLLTCRSIFFCIKFLRFCMFFSPTPFQADVLMDCYHDLQMY